MTETTIPAHAKGVSAALAAAGIRDGVSIRRSHEAVNVLPLGPTVEHEDRRIQALQDALEARGYECHRCAPMPWLIRVTGKRR